MKLHLPRKKLWIAALKLQRWPIKWWDEKVEERRNREKIRKEKIARLYPNKNEPTTYPTDVHDDILRNSCHYHTYGRDDVTDDA